MYVPLTLLAKIATRAIVYSWSRLSLLILQILGIFRWFGYFSGSSTFRHKLEVYLWEKRCHRVQQLKKSFFDCSLTEIIKNALKAAYELPESAAVNERQFKECAANGTFCKTKRKKHLIMLIKFGSIRSPWIYFKFNLNLGRQRRNFEKGV